MYLLLFIVTHLIIINVYASISFTTPSILVFSSIYLIVFSLIRYFQKKSRFEKHYNEAASLIDEKKKFLSEFEINFGKRKEKKDMISSVTRGFSIGSLFVDGGISGLIATGTGKIVNSSFDSSNKKDKQVLKDYDQQIDMHKSAIEAEDKEFKIEMIVAISYTVLTSIYMINF